MQINPQLLKRYWSEECTEEEKFLVRKWLASAEPQEDYFIDDLNESEEKELMMKSINNRIGRTILSSENTESLKPGHLPLRHSKKWIFAVAASVLLAVFFLQQHYVSQEAAPLSITSYHEVAVPYGEKRIITLTDGTIVHLNSGSRLKYPPQFSNSQRHVILSGEAYFIVAKNPDKPFTVETKHTTTRVLGTRFNLKEFANDQHSIIVIDEGRVQFSAPGCTDTLILTANSRAVFRNYSMEKSVVQASSYLSWKDNILHFNDIPLSEAIPIIERWYNVKIRIKDQALSPLKIKGDFKNPSLSSLLQDLSYLMNLKYKIKQNEVSLYQ
ncbi:FecR family protein [Pedobacter caeni]|uniref:FecR family protein n=1 Tax=Pedobacter caeni TaxID=288992 RepID=A0A1M5J3C2_9SPHI|nr:FecR domain-containing protein [Pedobacter caeni]SHG35118.1 FecR family protein [Pedobacter caeni]